MPSNIVIVGASLAGGTAAATLREEGFDGNIVLIGEEPHPPYERPPLSKEYLRGEAEFEKSLVRPADFYDANNIETRFGERVVRIDTLSRTVDLRNGSSISYNKLLIATGSRNRRLRLAGIDLEGVYDLRTVDDSDRIRSAASSGQKAAIVGMGFIGAELAASLRSLGLEVAVVELFQTALYKALGDELGRVVEGIHRDHGVEMFFDDQVADFEGAGRVERVNTQKGRSIECDFAIVGVGVEPAIDMLEGSDIAIDNGIVVDEFCRTNVEGVFAAGDVTNHYHPVFRRRMRVEHWQNAMHQGASAAKNMMGKDEPYDQVHWFWSDQYDVNLQYAGVVDEWDKKVVRGSLEDRKFVVFYVKDNRLVAAVGLNQGKAVRQSMKVIKAGVEVDPPKLEDEDVEIRSLIE